MKKPNKYSVRLCLWGSRCVTDLLLDVESRKMTYLHPCFGFAICAADALNPSTDGKAGARIKIPPDFGDLVRPHCGRSNVVLDLAKVIALHLTRLNSTGKRKP